jgi:hypothetical protein
VAEDENVGMTPADLLPLIGLVAVYARRERDVARSQEEDAVALAALTKVQSTGSLKVRSVLRSNLNTEGTSEGATNVSSGVFFSYVGDMSKKLWASGPGEDRLPESNLDVGELSGGEDLLAADGRGLGGLEREGPRMNPDPEIEGAGFFCTLSNSEADRINGRPQDSKGIEELVDLFT